MSLLIGKSTLLRVPSPIDRISVGNPAIADVTVQGKRVILMGHSYGVTNIIVLDRDGKQIAALDVTVQMGDKDAVQVFRAGGRSTLVCAPLCEQTVQIGDAPGRFKNVVSQITTKNGLAGGAAK
jgi:Flp pilus assembly secretin CpaC